jgi:glycosyltransferase involved in cell wall biosynthesis
VTSRRITIVSSEPLGRPGTGGAGTADSLLAVALGRHGHEVELLIATGREIGQLNDEWSSNYDSAGVQVRMLDVLHGVRPRHLAPTLEVFHALRERPPDVVIVNDWRGLGYAAMRSRQLGRALLDTAFVVHCHGPARVLAEFANKVPDTLERFREEITERASLELADAVASPSDWLLRWLRAHGWPVPDGAKVIQYVRQSVALDEKPPRSPGASRVTRLAFFGQLREGKGIRIFLTALNALEPHQLDGVALVFLGSTSKRWTGDRILDALSPVVRANVARIDLFTDLDRESALADLRQPGTLAVMPSLLDNSPNTVSECIEQGIPFIATDTGGISELVAAEDRTRVLCRPTSGELTAALSRALASPEGVGPTRPASEPHSSLDAWLELVTTVEPRVLGMRRRADRVAVITKDAEDTARVLRLAEAAETVDVEVVPADSREAGVANASADWIVFVDRDDDPDDDMIEALVAAQAASGADIVTAAVRPADDRHGVRLFLGDPGPLGLVENQYGVLGLVRRSLLDNPPDGEVDPDWPLFARLTLAGARIVSIPEPLSTHSGRPGRTGDVPGEGLAVLDAFEQQQIAGLPQLAATLAASYARIEPIGQSSAVFGRTGVKGVARRVGEYILRMLSAR